MGMRPPMRARQAVLAIAVLSLVASACGSTAPRTGVSGAPVAAPGAATGSNSGGGLSIPSAGSSAGSAGSLGGGSLGGGTSTGGSVGGGTTTGGSGGTTTGGGTTSGGTTTGGGGALPPGVTATTVNVGLAYVSNSGSANAALGAGSQDQGDSRRSYKVMLKIVNAQGGLDGHRIIPIYHHYDNTSNETVD